MLCTGARRNPTASRNKKNASSFQEDSEQGAGCIVHTSVTARLRVSERIVHVMVKYFVVVLITQMIQIKKNPDWFGGMAAP